MTTPNAEHLKMIQSMVDRMARASFALKGWSVTIAVALLGLSAKDSDRSFSLLAIYTVLALGMLDAYYLALERKYRELYADAVSGTAADWEMATSAPATADVLRAVGRPAVWALHASILVVALAVLLSA